MVLGDLRVPVVAAPMAGGASTPELVAASVEAGAFGFLAGGMLAPSALASQIDRVRELTDRPFGVNLFVPRARGDAEVSGYVARMRDEAQRYGIEPGEPEWNDDRYPHKLDVVVDRAVPVVSFTFAMPDPADVARVHGYGGKAVVTVATPDEARAAAAVGADALCVQGIDAGGHRGGLSDDGSDPAGGAYYGVLAALRVIAAQVDLPLIAAGGLARGADVAAVLTAGAVAAQLGSAFLLADESGIGRPYRQALADGDRPTAMTRSFTGRPARGLVNRFLVEHSGYAPAAYPQVHHLTKPIRAAAARESDPESLSLWAGQAYHLAEQRPAAEIIDELSEQLKQAIRAVDRFR